VLATAARGIKAAEQAPLALSGANAIEGNAADETDTSGRSAKASGYGQESP